MSTHRIYPALLLLAGCFAGACSSTAPGGDGEHLGSSRSALTLPPNSGTPVPLSWSGSFVQLLVADALVRCSFSAPDTIAGVAGNEDVVNMASGRADPYLMQVASLMKQDCGGPPGASCPCQYGSPNPPPPPSSVIENSTLAHWYLHRLDDHCNAADPNDPASKAHIDLQPPQVPQDGVVPQNIKAGDLPTFPVDPGSIHPGYAVNIAHANRILRMPSLNLCIARALRASAPGTAGSNDMLLLPAADQRELLEVTRERAQMAMIEFAELGVAFTSPLESTDPANFDSMGVPVDEPLRLVTAWPKSANATQQNQKGYLTTMAADFAAAVQLHSVVSQEIATLLARSSSAREPRGGHSTTLAAETWGPGSWRQRTLASLFGGNALAAEGDGTSPWPITLSTAFPAEYNWILGTEWYGNPQIFSNWPDPTEQPFFQVDMSRPEAQRLLALARAFDTTDLIDGGNYPGATGCRAIDRTTTAQALYMDTELRLEANQCASSPPTCNGTGGACQPVDPGATCQPYAGGDFSGCLLYTQHGITPDHATIAANYLADTLEPFCSSAGTGHFGSGARDLATGTISNGWVLLDGTTTALAFHLSPGARFVERGPMQIQPLYGHYGYFNMPRTAFAEDDPSSQGFDSWSGPSGSAAWGTDEAHRLAGSVPALVATREALLDAQDALTQNNPAGTYFAQANDILKVINAAVGPEGVTIRPVLWDAGNGFGGAKVSLNNWHDSAHWQVIVTRPDDDSKWNNTSLPLYAVFDDPMAASLVAHPTATVLGRTAASVLQTGASGSLTPLSTPASSGMKRFAGTFDVPLTPYAGHWQPRWVTLVADVGSPTSPEYVLLAGNTLIFTPDDVSNGYYLGRGGTLTTFGERLLYGQPTNPSKPAFDGFGLSTSWVPPTDPTLFGGAPGQDAAAHYLAQAQQASADATAAVQQAFTDLVQQATDDAAKQAAQIKGQSLVQQEQDALCGAGNTNCNTAMSQVGVLKNQNQPPACDPSATSTAQVLDCIASALMQSASSQFEIAKVVLVHKDEVNPPSFASYDGGSLQSLFIKQWGAIRQVNDAADDVRAGLTAAQSKVAAADAALQAATDQAQRDCSSDRMVAAAVAGTSVSGGFATATASFSPGPLIAQINKCTDETAGLPSQQAQDIAALNDAVLAMTHQASALHAAVENLAEVSAEVKLTVATAQRAQAQAAQDAQLASMTLPSGFGVYRDYHSYDLWRAQAMVDNARRYAVAARRAIEAKFLVDLSTMTADEAFVAAPSTWADQVYDYDLSLPAAVGLSVGTAVPSGIYPNKVADYIGNLQRFVDGYAVSRPTASASGESDVLTLLGPDAELPPACPASGAGKNLRASWSYYCPSTSQWVPGSSSVAAADICGSGGPPTKARVVFSIDAWGRVDTYDVQAPPSLRFNARWARIAVNLVGTGIKDCTKAADPLGCYSSSFLQYDLTHVGPSWVMDFEGNWRTLAVPIGQINLAKALVAEQWLDPISNGWDKPYVQAVERHEFTERPLDGTYQLELELGPEVRLGNIERVQILSDTSYWVRQQ